VKDRVTSVMTVGDACLNLQPMFNEWKAKRNKPMLLFKLTKIEGESKKFLMLASLETIESFLSLYKLAVDRILTETRNGGICRLHNSRRGWVHEVQAMPTMYETLDWVEKNNPKGEG
jgi:hypothetical protein